VINERRSRENGIDRRIKRQIVRQRVIEKASGSRRLGMGRADGSVGTDVYCATMYSSMRRVSSVSSEGDVESWIDLSLAGFLHVVSVNNGHQRLGKYYACIVASIGARLGTDTLVENHFTLHDDTPRLILLHIIHQATCIPRPSSLIPTLEIHNQDSGIMRIKMRRKVVPITISLCSLGT
jgi:hypothetical protein